MILGRSGRSLPKDSLESLQKGVSTLAKACCLVSLDIQLTVTDSSQKRTSPDRKEEIATDGGMIEAPTTHDAPWYLSGWIALARDFYRSEGFDVSKLDIRAAPDGSAVLVEARGDLAPEAFDRFVELHRRTPGIEWSPRWDCYAVRTDRCSLAFGGA